MIAVRDYFRIDDEAGKRYWVFREGDGEKQRDRLVSLVPARGVRMSGLPSMIILRSAALLS